MRLNAQRVLLSSDYSETFCPQTPFDEFGTGTPEVSAHWSAASVMLRSLLNTSDIFPLRFPECISRRALLYINGTP